MPTHDDLPGPNDDSEVNPDDLLDVEDLNDSDINPAQRVQVALAKIRNVLLVMADLIDQVIDVVAEID